MILKSLDKVNGQISQWKKTSERVLFNISTGNTIQDVAKTYFAI